MDRRAGRPRAARSRSSQSSESPSGGAAGQEAANGRPSAGSPYGPGGYGSYGRPHGGYGALSGRPGRYSNYGPPRPTYARLPGGLRLAAVERSKSLVARGPKDAVDKVADIVQAFDVAEGQPIGKLERLANLRVFNFEHASASEMAQLIDQLGLAVQVIEARDRGPVNAYSAEGTASVYSPPGGTLILSGPPEELAQAEELIKSLDAKAIRSPR